jgi:16S rRNA (cytosine967-C5)-methyltransferase
VVNAVLRKLAKEAESGTFPEWPNEATRLSYPTWIVKKLEQDLGVDPAGVALESMNQAASVTRRDDGYVQDLASQMVCQAVQEAVVQDAVTAGGIRGATGEGKLAGMVVVDLCAAPGGKATALAAMGATVIAGDLRLHRSSLIRANAERLGSNVHAFVGDGLQPPLRPGLVDHVLIDAPCSGLGSLRRRADARWRVDSAAPIRLGQLQTDLVESGLDLLKPGGILTYSVCTLTNEEGPAVLDAVLAKHPEVELLPTMSDPEQVPQPWVVSNQVAYLLPTETDGMMLWQLKKGM